MSARYVKDQPEGFSNRVKTVSIIGGGGNVGRHLLEALLQTGKFDVTAIQRPSSDSKVPDGVRVIRIDYSGDDDSALVNALQGQQALVITMAVTAPRDTIGKLISAAAKAGVPYVLPNWFGHDAANDVLLQDSMLIALRDALRSQVLELGVSSYFFLACNFWYEFSLGGGLDRFGFDFQNRIFVQFDSGGVKLNVSTWPQCGRAVANLLSLKELPEDETDTSPTLSQFSNGSVYISSFLVSQLDMFASVKRVTGTTDADWNITQESSKQRWEEGVTAVKQGNTGAFTKMMYSRMFFPTGDGDYESKRGLDNQVLDLPVEDLDEWTAVAVRMGETGEVEHAYRRAHQPYLRFQN